MNEKMLERVVVVAERQADVAEAREARLAAGARPAKKARAPKKDAAAAAANDWSDIP